VLPQSLTILNRAENLPFQIDAELSNEDLELTYRYFDLRRPALSRNLQIRHRVTQATRQYLDSQGFLEIETPILSKSTPEGARDFPRSQPIVAGKILRSAAGTTAVQATADGGRDGEIFSDRESVS
jgi:aspartyl-tRNA synthetase